MLRPPPSEPVGEEVLQAVGLSEPVYGATESATLPGGDGDSVFADDEAAMYNEYIAAETAAAAAEPANFQYDLDISGLVDDLVGYDDGM